MFLHDDYEVFYHCFRHIPTNTEVKHDCYGYLYDMARMVYSDDTFSFMSADDLSNMLTEELDAMRKAAK